MGALPVPRMTVEEYLAADQTSERPLEYHDGEVFPLAEASLAHGAIQFNLSSALRSKLEAGPCRGTGSVRVRVSPTQYLYPDVLVFCGQPELSKESDPSLTNPKVIFEILSPSTSDYDFGAKFQLYRQLPSFEEYILIAQDQPKVEVFRRLPDGRWILTIYEGLEATISLDSLNIQLPLSEIYARVF
ncbi:MAG: Uma2 family endonuclease [Acidobacteria bacterium]|nr:Uma2 family endonuclease [Acidobacteriota bacterium]